jgi:hypothetical protein
MIKPILIQSNNQQNCTYNWPLFWGQAMISLGFLGVQFRSVIGIILEGETVLG